MVITGAFAGTFADVFPYAAARAGPAHNSNAKNRTAAAALPMQILKRVSILILFAELVLPDLVSAP